MKITVAGMLVLLLASVTACFAQSAPNKTDSVAPECTDLSGKTPLPCPREREKTAGSAASKTPSAPASEPAPTPAAKQPAPAEKGNSGQPVSVPGVHPVS